MQQATNQFSSATSKKGSWEENVDELTDQLGTPHGSVGILYTSEDLAPFLAKMINQLRIKTSVKDWVSASGYGTISQNEEVFGESASCVMVLDLPVNGYRVFSGNSNLGTELAAQQSDWLTEATMPLAITHVDPRRADAVDAINNLAEKTSSFLIGGLTAASSDSPHLVKIEKECISGVAISPIQTEILTGLSQGCSPISKTLTVTKAKQNIIIELDKKPAFDVLMECLGDEFQKNIQTMAGTIFIAFPIPGSDTADYTVRNLIGLDPDNKVIAISEHISEGDPLLICRRDEKTAVEDMRRMVTSIKQRLKDKSIRGGIYISCAARGPNQFAATNKETDIIREVLGDFPIVGFFANGEISRDRVYAYTGVIAVFT
jgi:small ligand-binding sensory domain FIST